MQQQDFIAAKAKTRGKKKAGNVISIISSLLGFVSLAAGCCLADCLESDKDGRRGKK